MTHKPPASRLRRERNARSTRCRGSFKVTQVPATPPQPRPAAGSTPKSVLHTLPRTRASVLPAIPNPRSPLAAPHPPFLYSSGATQTDGCGFSATRRSSRRLSHPHLPHPHPGGCVSLPFLPAPARLPHQRFPRRSRRAVTRYCPSLSTLWTTLWTCDPLLGHRSSPTPPQPGGLADERRRHP